MSIVDLGTFRNMARIAGDSLGFCEPPLSDFDAVIIQGEVVGAKVNVEVGKIVKSVKPKTTRIFGPKGHNAVAGNGHSMTVHEAREILPDQALNQVNNGLRRDVGRRKLNLAASNGVK